MVLPLILLAAALQQDPVRLDVPAGLPEQFQTTLELNGDRVTLKLQRRSLRSEGFILENTAGPIETIPPSRTYFGFVEGVSGATVAASLEPRGLLATILLPDRTHWRLAPVPALGNGWHQLARAQPGPAGMCGVVGDTWSSHSQTPSGGSTLIPPPSRGNRYSSPYPWDWTMRKSRIAFDATYDYWLREGQTVAGVTAGVEYQLAENDLTCSRDALVSYELTGIVIRQAPYYTGTTSGALLGEFGNEWDANQGHIPRESAVMLDDYQGDGIAGLAWVGTLGGGLAYAGLYWDRGYSPGIIAHEVGHNWGAGHIDCWPWGGSAMCGSWLLYGPETTNIIQSRAAWLGLAEIAPYADPVRPYADPDWVAGDTQSDLDFDVLDNDYDANFEHIHVSAVDPVSAEGGSAFIRVGAGPGGRDLIQYQPDRLRFGPYTDTFWYAAADPSNLEHWTPVTVSVREHNLVAEWKFEEEKGNRFQDSSGKGNLGIATGPKIYAELSDPSIVLECINDGSNPSSNLWDNDGNTDFSSANQGVVSASFTRDPSDGTWLEFDFGSTTAVMGFRHQDRKDSSVWINKSILWFSQDNVFDSNDTKIEILHHSHGKFVEYGFNAVHARYVRWEVTEQYNPASGSYFLGGRELSFLYDSRMAELEAPSVSLSSNALSGNGAENLVDNDSKSEFVSSGQGVGSAPLTRDPADGTWAEFDFHAMRTFEGASFLDLQSIRAWTGQSRLWFSNTADFSLSDANVVWDHGNQGSTQVLDFNQIQARYVRWEISKKAPLTFNNNMGGRELTLYSNLAHRQGFQRVSGPFGEGLQVLVKLKASVGNARDLPTAHNEPFSVNVFIKPDSGLDDGAMIAGFGSPTQNSGRYFELIEGRLHFAGFDTGWSPPTSAWSMLTATFDGTSLKLFRDAVLLGTWSTSFQATANEMHLAPTDSVFSSAHYRGLIDELALWNYALNDSEVAGLLSGGAAHGPAPFDGRTGVSDAPRLSWMAARNAPQHDVYLATDFDAARDATPGSSEYIGRYSEAHVDLQNLTAKTWYFWRIDEIHSNGDHVPGKVWRFRTELPWTTTALEAFADGNDGDHLNGLGGGIGFGAPWDVPAGNGYLHRAGSLGAYPSNLPFVEAGGYLERKAIASLPMEGQRFFDANAIDVDLARDESYYLSFALRLSGVDSGMTAMCGLRDSRTGGTLLAGSESGSWAINGAAGTASAGVVSKSRAQFVVLRIDASGQSDDLVWMKIYDSAQDLVHSSDTLLSGIGTGANQWNLLSSGADSSGNFDQLFIRAGGNGSFFSTSIVEMDEIRVGRSWSDVTGL